MTTTLIATTGTTPAVPRTVAGLPAEDIVLLASGTPWQVAWELQMLGPFASCGLLDGAAVRHVTVPTMVASALKRSSRPPAALVPSDYERMPVFGPELPISAAAALVASTGWSLAVVMDHEPRVITARTVFRALVDATPYAAERDVWSALRSRAMHPGGTTPAIT
ncbi:MAG: hypothetical protein Q7V57_08860 [Actinomycetota bacterium]|nr:hypothetical protein [Actinomycetota bacterium]